MSLDPHSHPDPEALRAERQRLMGQQHSGVPAPPIPPAHQPGQIPDVQGNLQPWEQGLDFRQIAEDITRQQADDLHRQSAEAQARGEAWSPRVDPPSDLLHVEADGAPRASVPRAVDMSTATSFGERSRQAISIINQAFKEMDVSELHFDAPDKIFAKYQGKRVRIKAAFDSEAEYNLFIEQLVRQSESPQLWEEMKDEGWAVIRMAGGDRMLVWFPPLVENLHVAIHKVVARTWDMDVLVRNGTLTQSMADFLIASVQAKANILICGELGAGKSVMLSLLAKHIEPNERILLMEEVPEIFMTNPDLTRITYNLKNSKGKLMTLSHVLDGGLYGRYDRMIIGELHDLGAFRMLQTMMTGGDGSMCTFHAGDVQTALERARNHVLLEHPQLATETVAHNIRQAINLVLVLKRIDGQHRVSELSEVNWRNNAGSASMIGANRLFYWDREGKHPSRGGVPGFVADGRPDPEGPLSERASDRGVYLDPAWFAGEHFGQR